MKNLTGADPIGSFLLATARLRQSLFGEAGRNARDGARRGLRDHRWIYSSLRRPRQRAVRQVRHEGRVRFDPRQRRCLGGSAADEIQFLYCAADATIPGMASGSDAKLIAAPLVGLPGSCSRAKISNGAEELKGKSIAVTRPGDLTFRLARALLKKFNLTENEVKILTVGGTGQVEPFNAMRAGFAEAAWSRRPSTCVAGATAST